VPVGPVVVEVLDHIHVGRRAQMLIHVRKACPQLTYNHSLVKAGGHHDNLYSFSSPGGIYHASEVIETVVQDHVAEI